MSKLVSAGDAIEGLAIEGHSRRPLEVQTRGITVYRGKRCYKFVVRFNVRSWITKGIPGELAREARLHPEACDSLEMELLADKAIIHSLKRRYGSDVKKGSATHKANHWRFPQQTVVIIDQPHVELLQTQAAR